MKSHLSPRCEKLSQPNAAEFSVAVFIIIGILVSYLPQHYKIIARRSSRGLSPLFVLLGTVSGTASIANVLTLPQSTEDMGCCRDISRFACASALLGVVQIGVQWSCFFFIMLLFLIFFPRPSSRPSTPPSDSTDSTDPSSSSTSPPTYKSAILVLALSLLFFLATLLGSITILYTTPSHLQAWANFLGLTGTLLAAIQYIPQILTTWRLQSVGSLSVPMMCIQTPGSFVFAASLAVRLGKSGWSTWGLFIVTGVLQGVLLGMSLGFLWRERRGGVGMGKGVNGREAGTEQGVNGNGNGNAGGSRDGSDEQTPLLSNGDGRVAASG
ncbi:hypothetical protein K491DRAFT_702382 [Lophiostoma macrostomum CBS 122681]|uniref:PQ loop repeat protein-like protein n=1 Tax=Lophiostoma macrostomum CBS 122681 TaxID=1314788 RepID=A0A6A6TJD3_9PLEO|nr:hypothetical protein K491DRAFT_702382 [Lophiostoma macrostomum CBS 122681]